MAQLLIEMDGVMTGPESGVIVIATTNSPQKIDMALLRPGLNLFCLLMSLLGRFDRLIYVPPPSSHTRICLLQNFTKKMRIAFLTNKSSQGNISEDLLREKFYTEF